MRNILVFIIRYHFLLLFLLLEFISVTLLVNSTYYQSSAILKAGSRVTGRFYTTVSDATDYLKLRTTNEHLAQENAMLRQMKGVSYLRNDTNSFWVNDTLYKQQYKYIVAKVVLNTVGKRNNYIMLDKGSRSGIQKDMAVITPTGIAGTVVNVSENFSWVMSMLNKHTRLSGKILKNGQMGTVVWNGVDHLYGTLTDIPAHVKIARGDTIVSSGFSYIFPAGLMIGTITDYRVEQGEHFYTIPFKFSVDFNSLQYVYVVKNLMKEEQESLEKSTEGLKDE
ncbi:MAG TPA: rod shape-determining protein MreC [Bacteroidales bacterium]|jgi:rod shape-determining protein MreC|nr:rod shape-determining protein MreC [Bacteroidales bacterium]